jgi:hypothetical protein
VVSVLFFAAGIWLRSWEAPLSPEDDTRRPPFSTGRWGAVRSTINWERQTLAIVFPVCRSGVFRTSNLATTSSGLEAGGVITINQTAAGYKAMRLGDRLMPPSTNCVARTGLNTAKNFWQTWLSGLPDLASVGLKSANCGAIGDFIRPILRFGSQ